MTLAGKVAIVTGGTRGIGRAIARGLAEDGASLAVVGRDPGRVSEAVSELEGKGVPSHGIVADLTRSEDVQRAVTETHERFGRIDLLVNNAGITRDALLVRMKDQDWDDVLAVNLKAAFQATRAAARVMARLRIGYG